MTYYYCEDKDGKLELQLKEKKNKWKALVQKTASKIATFIGLKKSTLHIYLLYVPQKLQSKSLNKSVDRELVILESQPEYRAALEALKLITKAYSRQNICKNNSTITGIQYHRLNQLRFRF